MTTASFLLGDLLERIDLSPFTVASICRRAGIDPSQVSRWKAGKIEPRVSSLDRLENAFAELLTEHRLANPGTAL